MQSPLREWQVALQRAKSIHPKGKSPSEGVDFSLDALLESDNRRRVDLVCSTALHRQREDEDMLQRMHAAIVRIDMVLEGSTSPAAALRKSQSSYVKRWKEQSKEFSEIVAAWNVARVSAANATTDLTSVSFTSNSSNLMSRRSPAKLDYASQKMNSNADGAFLRLGHDDSNISAVVATATPAQTRSKASKTEDLHHNADRINPNIRHGQILHNAPLPQTDSGWSHNTSSSAASAALASNEGSATRVTIARSPTSEIKSAKRLIKEQPDAIYNCLKRLCKRIESEISSGTQLPSYDENILLSDSTRLNALVLQSLTKGARLDEFTPVEAAAGLAYVLVAVVQDAVLPVAWALKHLPSSMHDDSHFTQAVALLPQAQQRLLVAVKKHIRHLGQHVPPEQLESLVRNRLAPCLLRSHNDHEAGSLVASLLLRHPSAVDGLDASVFEGALASATSTTAIAPLNPTDGLLSAISVTPAPTPAAASACDTEPGGPPARLPPPPPKAAPAAVVASGGELLLPLNKSRSRSGSMDGSTGYASFKKELQDGLQSSLPELDDD